jgi:preprotein translocase subunit SecA
MDPKLISGIGNIYSDEILHQAKILPDRKTSSLSKTDLKNIYPVVKDFAYRAAHIIVNRILADRDKPTLQDYEQIIHKVEQDLSIGKENFSIVNFVSCDYNKDCVIETLTEYIISQYDKKIYDAINAIKEIEEKKNDNDGEHRENNTVDEEDHIESYAMEAIRWILLENIDQAWRQHIVNLDNIREGIGLRGYGQKTPLIEYKQEAYNLFQHMTEALILDTLRGFKYAPL